MRYNNNIINKLPSGKRYFKYKIYPPIPLSSNDEYIITTESDRLDNIAYSYYKDTQMWWVISVANNNINKGSLFVPAGTQLRIPTNLSEVLRLFNEINNI